MRRYLIIIERPDAEGVNYGAYCPDLPGCVSTGMTENEVIDNMAEAIRFHLEGMLEDGDPIPENTVRAIEIAIPDPLVRRTAA